MSRSIALKQGLGVKPIALSWFWDELTRVQRLVFWGTLSLKVVASCLYGSRYSNDLFVPFIDYFVSSGFSNPWAHFAHSVPDAFPYSGGMLALLSIPRLLLNPFMQAGTVSSLHLLALRIPLLVADIVILRVLVSWFPTRMNRVLFLYWCSPIVFYISYIHGQLDALPTALVLVALASLIRKRFLLSGLLYGAAISTKFSVLAIAPFLILYPFKRSERIQSPYPDLARWVSGVLLSLSVLVVPFCFAPSFR